MGYPRAPVPRGPAELRWLLRPRPWQRAQPRSAPAPPRTAEAAAPLQLLHGVLLRCITLPRACIRRGPTAHRRPRRRGMCATALSNLALTVQRWRRGLMESLSPCLPVSLPPRAASSLRRVHGPCASCRIRAHLGTPGSSVRATFECWGILARSSRAMVRAVYGKTRRHSTSCALPSPIKTIRKRSTRQPRPHS